MRIKKLSRWTAALVMAAVVAGCVSRPNGPPPDPRQFALGETTEAQVIAQLGEPQRRTEQVFNVPALNDRPAHRVVSASLTYGAVLFRGQLGDGTTFSFRDGLLRGYRMAGASRPGFAGYDFEKVRDLLANKATTRSDVVALLGDPSVRTLLDIGGTGTAAEQDRYLFIVPVGFGTSERIYKGISVIYDRSGHIAVYDLNEVRR